MTDLVRGLKGLGSDPFVSFIFSISLSPFELFCLNKFVALLAPHSPCMTSSLTTPPPILPPLPYPGSRVVLFLEPHISTIYSCLARSLKKEEKNKISPKSCIPTIESPLFPFLVFRSESLKLTMSPGRPQPWRHPRLSVLTFGRLNCRIRRNLQHL